MFVVVPLMNLSRAYSVERRRLMVFQQRECRDSMMNVCMGQFKCAGGNCIIQLSCV